MYGECNAISNEFPCVDYCPDHFRCRYFSSNCFIEKAQAEFKQSTLTKQYKPGIPEDVMPPRGKDSEQLETINR